MELYCRDCGAVFDEDEAGRRNAREEDSMWGSVATCPSCGSDDVTEAHLCKRCGKPIEDGDFCEDCDRELYKSVEALICDEVLTESFPGDFMDAKEVFLEYIERVWF